MATLEARLLALAGAVRDKFNANAPRLLPSGGASGQALVKIGAGDYAVAWDDVAGGGGPDMADPAAPTILRDDFITQSTETGEAGNLNWSFTNGSFQARITATGHPGIQRRRSGTTANQVASLYLGAAVSVTILQMQDFDECTWIFREAAAGVTDTTYQWGLFSAVGALNPTHGIYLESLSTDTNWFFVCRNGGAQTRVDTGVASRTTNFIKVKMRRIAAGEVGFSINGGAEVTITTNVPDETDEFNVGMQFAPTATTFRECDYDFFSLKTLASAR